MFKFAVFAVFFAAHVVEIQGCHAVANHDSRRKRAADDDVGLRQFFDSCMAEQYGGGSFITEVDWVILDSIWYDDVASTNCIVNDQDDAECWKNNLDDLVADGPLGVAIKSCIDQYEEQENGLDRRKRRSVSRNILKESKGSLPTILKDFLISSRTITADEIAEEIESVFHACEHQAAKELQCPVGHVIRVIDAFYGRKSTTICSERDVTDCSAVGSRQIIETLCNGYQSCRIDPRNTIFTDPCRGVRKYVEVTYQCVQGRDRRSRRYYKRSKEYSRVYPSSPEEIMEQGQFADGIRNNTNIRERGLGRYDYQRLSAFVQTQTIERSCNNRKREGLVQDWQARFVDWTKPRSDLYEAIRTTASQQAQVAEPCKLPGSIVRKDVAASKRMNYNNGVVGTCPRGGVWTSWHNRDHPSATGDWEIRSHYSPKGTCVDDSKTPPLAIQARLFVGKLPYQNGGDVVTINPDLGFICENNNQGGGRCDNYEVRYCCPPKVQGVVGYCDPEKDEWTPWDNRDRPSGSGDWETRRDDRLRGTCASEDAAPKAIQARLVKDQQPYTTSGETVTISPGFGFVCRNRDQGDKYCEDYEVRYCCPRKIIG